MQFFLDYPLMAGLACCSVLVMLGLTMKVRRWQKPLRFLVVSWLVLLGMLLAGMYSVNHVAYVAKDGLRNNLSGLAKSFAIALEDAGHEKVTLETPDDDPLYWKIIDMMSNWQKQIPAAASIYTCRKNAEGELVFICCPPADLNRDGQFLGENEELIPKGTIYEFDSEEDIREILDAFKGKSGFNNVPVKDDWGLWITASEPLFDETGERVDAVLGVDFWGEDWNAAIHNATFWSQLFLLSAVILFFAVQVFIIQQRNVEDRLTEYTAHLEKIMEELVAAKKEADVAAQTKSYFLANISHEIRTPLNAILGGAEILVNLDVGRTVEEDRTQLVDMMRKSSKNLTTLIDDVLTFSSIDMKRIVLESVSVHLRRLIEDVKMMVGSNLAEKPALVFKMEYGESVPDIIFCDPVRLRQVLLCLINNAIKFTHAGNVTVRCSVFQPPNNVEQKNEILPALTNRIILNPQIAHAKGLRGITHVTELFESQTILNHWSTLDMSQVISGNKLILQIAVSDTGIGIPPEQFEVLFKPFAQIDNTSTRKFGGTGLGLSIVKGLVQLMRGTIHVESKLGYGSTFSILLPVDVSHESLERAPPPEQTEQNTEEAKPPLQGYNILIVDDTLVNRLVVESKLRDMGAKTQSAPNGQIAIDMVAEADQQQLPFDFIVMDLQMPVMDGFEATSTLRQKGFAKPIVALTANKDSDAQALASGCNRVLLKPADGNVLFRAITELVQR
jgi:signal transduction histidine kinase/CheY-like chemotaxis protein